MGARKRYYHRKLVRDGIPELIKSNGDEAEVKKLSEKEYERELRKKLVEEAKELAWAPQEELVNELADVLELLKTISAQYDIDFREVERYRVEKRRKRGGFSKKLFVVWSTGKPGK